MSEQQSAPVVEQPASRGLLLAVLSLVWMAAMLFSARITITGGPDAEMEVTSTAYALPGAVSAALVTGIAVALAVLGLVAQRRSPGATTRFAIATGTGLVVGLLGALVVVTINTEGWLYAVVGGTIAAASTIGGALAGLRMPRVLAAVCWGSIAVFVVGFLLNVFQNPVLDALGSGDSEQSQTSAAQWFSFSQSLLSGVAAGIVGQRLLRRARRRAGGADVSPAFYFLAGGGPGLLLLVGEALTRTAGARVLDLAGKVSVLELTVQKLLSGARFNSALIVLFAGAITAAVAYGIGIKPAAEDEPHAGAEPEPAPASAPAEQAG
jgi:iron complex transport system permease protein